MGLRIAGAQLLLLVVCCGLAQGFLYNYCQAPLPRFIAPANSNTELVQVSVFSRHGDRSPTMPLPQENVDWICGATDEVELEAPGIPSIGPLQRNIFIDENSPFSFELWGGNCTIGQLTSKGATQSYLLGQQLRSIYISTLKFIPSTFDPSLVFIRSTDVWRTQQSAEANLLGLYPLGMRNGYTPIINIAPANIETMYSNLEACPILASVIYNLTISPEYLQHLEAFMPTLDKLNRVCNTTNYFGANSSWTTLDFWDNLQARTCHSLPLPCNAGECINKTDMAALGKEGNFEFPYLLGGAVQNRFGMGFFMAEVLQHILDVVNGTSQQRYAYYSGHDSTLAAILDAWNVSDSQWPPYASNILLETWQTKGSSDLYIRMLYNGDLLNFPFCKNGQFCEFDEFYAYYQEYLKPDVRDCFAATV